jgi:hypothetical protein
MDWALVDKPNQCGDLGEKKKKDNNKFFKSKQLHVVHINCALRVTVLNVMYGWPDDRNQ